MLNKKLFVMLLAGFMFFNMFSSNINDVYANANNPQKIATVKEKNKEQNKKEIKQEEVKEVKEEKLLENGLPKAAYEWNLNIIHKEKLPYWKWSEIDKEYLKEKFGYNVNEKLLTQEIYELIKASDYWMEQYSEINNFKFYPSNVSGVIDSISRAIKARYNLLSGQYYSYPKPSQGLLGSTDVGTYEIPTSEDYVDYFITNDLQRLEILKSIPFDTSYFKDREVYNIPFKVRSLMHNCDATGVANGFSKQIFIVSYLQDATSTFYHEAGHLWSYLYLNNDFSGYLKVRNKENYEDSRFWKNSVTENFAEDFKSTMYPQDAFDFKTSFGSPDKKMRDKLESFILENQKNKKPSWITINDKNYIWDIFTTEKDHVNIEGYTNEPVNFYAIKPDLTKEKINVKFEKGYFKFKYTFDEEGEYNIYSPLNTTKIIYNPNFNDYEYKVTIEDVIDIEEENTVKEISPAKVGFDVRDWLQHQANYFSYYDVLETPNGLYVSFFDRGGKKIELDKIEVTETSIKVKLKDSNKERVLLKVPLSLKDKKIEVNKNFDDSFPKGDDKRVRLFNPKSTLTYDKKVYVTGYFKSKTGKIYYEMVSNKTNEVLFSGIEKLQCSYPHWGWSAFAIKSEDIDENKVTINVYEDESKECKLTSPSVKLKR